MSAENHDIATASLGIELGSTRIKACLVAPGGETIAIGSSSWENQLVDGLWTYPLDAVRAGLQAAYADLVAQLGSAPSAFGAIGVSAMMHGYLAFDATGELLVPFRTWRNTNTGAAAAALSDAFGVNIPLRWSIAHLHQAVLDREPHVPRIARVTTLAGYVHELLTGRDVLGVGDASGMFPIDPATVDYDERLVGRYEKLAAAGWAELRLRELLPAVLPAGADAGELTADGAALLDPSGALQAGIPLCPPEGDAGTGMVATDAVRPRTANVSAGTSIFAMVVLERPLAPCSPRLDLVTTPDGSPVAMVHCNNGASELGAWVGVFQEFAAAIGSTASSDEVFDVVLGGALDTDGDGLLAYNLLSGEPIIGPTKAGRSSCARRAASQPRRLRARAALLRVRGPEPRHARPRTTNTSNSTPTSRTAGCSAPAESRSGSSPAPSEPRSSVGETAGEGGAWGIAVLAAYRRDVASGIAAGRDLGTLARRRGVRGCGRPRRRADRTPATSPTSPVPRRGTGRPLRRACGDRRHPLRREVSA